MQLSRTDGFDDDVDPPHHQRHCAGQPRSPRRHGGRREGLRRQVQEVPSDAGWHSRHTGFELLDFEGVLPPLSRLRPCVVALLSRPCHSTCMFRDPHALTRRFPNSPCGCSLRLPGSCLLERFRPPRDVMNPEVAEASPRKFWKRIVRHKVCEGRCGQSPGGMYPLPVRLERDCTRWSHRHPPPFGLGWCWQSPGGMYPLPVPICRLRSRQSAGYVAANLPAT